VLTVVESSAAADRLAAAADFVRSFDPGTELVLLGATREAIDDFARTLAAEHGASFGWHRFTLTQLAAFLAQPLLAARGIAPIVPVTAAALAARAIFAELNAGRLPFLSPVARFPGFTRAVAASIDELRLARVDAAALARLDDGGTELARLLTAFEAEIAAAAVADRTALLEAAIEAVRRATAPVGCPLLLLDVALESQLDCDFVAALVTATSASLATLPSGDDRSRRWLTPLAAETYRPPAAAAAPSSLERLRQYLFSEAEPPAGKADDAVRFFSAPGEQRECVEVARWILEEARDGTRFDDIAIFLRAPQSYTLGLQHALQRAAIPAYFARGTQRPDPAGRALLALLACKAEGLSAKRFAEYLSLGQVPADDSRAPAILTPDACPEPGRRAERPTPAESDEGTAVVDGSLRAPWKWEELLVEAAVIGGTQRWERRLAGLAAQLHAQLADAEDDDLDAPRLHALRRELTNLDHLRRFALPVIERLDRLPTAAAWGEWLSALLDLAPDVLRQPQRVLDLLAALQPMAAVGPVSLDEVRDVLAERLSTLEQDPPASRYGCVFVAPPEQARGRRFAVVFVPGLAERIFPQRPREDPLLLDELRAQLGDALVTQDERARRERLQLQLAVGAATRRVVFSYPRVEAGEGRARVPSFYGLDVERAVSGRVPDYEELQRQTAAVADARLAWPAPADPARAIDDIEHDLAVLSVLLHQTTAEHSKGRARYLLELNPHLARALRSRWQRWESTKWQPADGLVRATAALQPVLDAHKLSARPYSVSALQRFAECPYKFFLAAIVGLEKRDDPAPLERIDPLTRGRLVHATQAELLRSLQAGGRLPLSAGDLDTASAELDRHLDQVAERFRDDLAPAIERVWHDEIDTIRTDLRIWLKHLVESGAEWEPLRFELGFGLAQRDGLDLHSVAEPVRVPGNFLLRGAVDLVERRRNGSVLRVTDHKTGKDRTPVGFVVGGGAVLQPVLYSLAVEAALAARVAEARLFFCTAAAGFSERFVRIDDDARRAAQHVLSTIDAAIAGGALPPAPLEGACERCDFREVCGPYEEIRAARKEPQLLRPLQTLRGLT
jgi:CRISPR/Cas system-associated exonuclease Cas4 (RecB family)